MYYIKLDKKEIKGSPFKYVYVEVDEEGYVIKELGFDNTEKVVHKFPCPNCKYGTYGLFDLSLFDINELKSDIDETSFYIIWNNAQL